MAVTNYESCFTDVISGGELTNALWQFNLVCQIGYFRIDRSRLWAQVLKLPSVVIKSGWYAAIRRDRGRQYTGNDLHDFGHASAALPYFDYFATDKALKHLIANELKYDRKYGVLVICEPSEFLQLLKQI